jgi:hypothetical protein
VTDEHLALALAELSEGGRLAQRIAGFAVQGEPPGPPPGPMGPTGFPAATVWRGTVG